MTHEELRAWCHGEMRAIAGSPMYARGAAFLKLLDASLAPPWLADAAEALGEVRSEDSAPLALNWTQVIHGIRELREDRDTLLKVSRIVNDALNGESPLDREQRAAWQHRAEAAEKQVKAIAMLVSIFERQRENEPDEGWPEGDLHPSQVLLAIGETIGQPCSICRSRHGSEVRHAAE